MANFVTVTDFSNGELAIGKNIYNTATLQEYIDRLEPEVLRHLLGCDLYNAFISDWDGSVFTEQRFTDIYNPFCYDESSCVMESKGMKKMLMYFIYTEFINDNQRIATVVGDRVNQNNNSETVNLTQIPLFKYYNSGVYTWWAIQWYICKEIANYSEYNGQPKELMSWL